MDDVVTWNLHYVFIFLHYRSRTNIDWLQKLKSKSIKFKSTLDRRFFFHTIDVYVQDLHLYITAFPWVCKMEIIKISWEVKWILCLHDLDSKEKRNIAWALHTILNRLKICNILYFNWFGPSVIGYFDYWDTRRFWGACSSGYRECPCFAKR